MPDTLEIKRATRVFKYKDLSLPDINPSLNPKEVIEFYSNQFPELANGFVEGEEIGTNGDLIIKVSTSVGTKG